MLQMQGIVFLHNSRMRLRVSAFCYYWPLFRMNVQVYHNAFLLQRCKLSQNVHFNINSKIVDRRTGLKIRLTKSLALSLHSSLTILMYLVSVIKQYQAIFYQYVKDN